ncbi:MAG: hypothetical protein IPO89_13720 [Actinomycetales bacterium]|nr:hypothetical protein [Candidatus Lutibacillus vidarii]
MPQLHPHPASPVRAPAICTSTTRAHPGARRWPLRRHRHRRGARRPALPPVQGQCRHAKLERLIDEVGADQIAYVNVAVTVNLAGGQPVSMANLRAVREVCDRHGIIMWSDATRLAENAYFIQERRPGMPVCRAPRSSAR